MDSFSWSDSLRAALGSCLPCLRHESDEDEGIRPPTTRHGQLYNREELEGLLVDSQTDNEAETMSLHSNVGSGGRTRKKKKAAWRGKKKRGVKLFGIDLFGRPLADAVSDDEEEDTRPRRRGVIDPIASSTSSSTLDSDAAPLADSTIASLSRWEPTMTDADLAREEEDQRLREEKQLRKERRRERKERRKLAVAFAAGEAGIGDGEEFEGFQGSGSYLPPKLPSGEEFGPFKDAKTSKEGHDQKSTGTSGSGSHSRSTSTSNYHLIDAPSPSNVPLPPSSAGSAFNEPPQSPTPRRKKSRSKPKLNDKVAATTSNRSHSSANSSTSIASPPPPSSPGVQVLVNDPSHSETFEGYPVGDIDTLPQTGFPSTGFGSRKSTNAAAGVVLARRGDY